MAIELVAKEAKEIPEGRHNAVITRLEERTEPYHYIDIYYRLSDVDIEIKDGCSASLSNTSKLGKLLMALGAKFKAGESVDIGKKLIGKKVSLATVNEEVKGKGTFARVVDNSVRLA